MTGLIYVILIAVWGVVLVPRWLRRHDEAKNADPSEALEVALTGEQDNAHSSAVEENRAESWGEYVRGLTSVDLREYTNGFRGVGARSAAARRRGRILVGLAVSVGVSLVGAMVGVLPSVIVVATVLATTGYVVAMIFYMNRQSVASAPQTFAASSSAPDIARHESVATAGASVDGVRIVVEDSEGWDPQATTLPTYVSKTKASKIPRRIDLTSGWTGADMVAQAREQQAGPNLEQQFDREWAAVEPDPEVEIARYAQGIEEDETYYRRAVNE